MVAWLNRLVQRRSRKKILIAELCKHAAPRRAFVTAFGERRPVALAQTAEKVDWCPSCLGKMAIQCAWCGRPIFVGDPITLYSQRRDVAIADEATVYNQEYRQLVGCLRMNCAESGGDRAGFWIASDGCKGRVHRVMSPMEEALFGGKDGTFLDTVIVGDLGDMRSSKPLPQDKPIALHVRGGQEYIKGR